ncbi:hypothetical protein [Sulfurospirillum multivorans]|uniref:Uncharacterized protein n=2 Tax=Sulfurospirillum multivorans TaxID=66821 RepID=A0AA86AJF9_SULMK|nr:hypothetical protein [Sulfurospirillum multivorans]AHJ11534.1 hypothetical protein SMUL_0252 [Sulfurospirillum multivorans DSM 12446]QEH05035.1 hypothetical protein SMN_0246 [Sulfurospirillum multivorans]
MQTQNDQVPNHFDAHFIFQALNQDIHKDRWSIPFIILLFLALTLLLFPITFLYLVGMVAYADLPIVNHSLLSTFSTTKFVLVPYSLVLIFYFYATYNSIQDKKQHAYEKAHFFLITSLVVGCFPFIWYEYRLIWYVIYALLFGASIYYLSIAYLGYEDKKGDFTPMNENNFIRNEDMGIYGFIDDPLSTSDDINRAKLTVATASAGFTLIGFLTKMALHSWIYFIATGNKKYILEAVRFLDALFENKMNQPRTNLSHYAKAILSYKGYIVFASSGLEVTEKSKQLADRARKITREKEFYENH